MKSQRRPLAPRRFLLEDQERELERLGEADVPEVLRVGRGGEEVPAVERVQGSNTPAKRGF